MQAVNRARSSRNREINKNIEKRIAEYRQKRGMTQAQLAQKIGLSTTWIQQIEYGNTEPSIAKIIIFAEALNVDPHELFIETKIPTVNDCEENFKPS